MREMQKDLLKKLEGLLSTEEIVVETLRKTKAAHRLSDTRQQLLAIVHEATRSADLSLIVAVEKTIVEGDLARYANSASMSKSLNVARNEIAAIERHLDIVDDPARYQPVDQAHRLPKNRRANLLLDEARQALASHQARLDNLDKSRLDDDEKQLVEARKSALQAAGRLYIERQAKALGVTASE